MSIIFDAAILALLTIYIIKASKRNDIVSEVTKTVTVLFSSGAALKFSSFLSNATFEIFFKDAVAKNLLPLTEKIYYLEGQSSNTERILRALPDFIANGARWMVFNDELAVTKLESYVCHPAKIAAEEISSLVAGPVFTSLFSGIYILLGYIIFYNIFKLIFSSFKADLSGMGISGDSVICGCVGALRGFIYIVLLTGTMNFIFPVFGFYGEFLRLADGSSLFRLLLNENIFCL